jgi:hypothetical membrane protein
MDKSLLNGFLIFNGILAVILIVLLWRKHETRLTKIIWSLIILIPCIGAVLFGLFFYPVSKHTHKK